MLAHVLEQFGLVDGHAGSGADERADLFSPLVIRDADYGNVTYGGMSEQHLFEFARVDVLTATDDHVLQAALDGEVAAFVHRTQIPGVQPAVGIDRR